MSPGSIVEESSKIAQTTINALNSVPVLLALVLLQFFILGGVMYLNIGRDKNVHDRFMKLIDGCLVIQKDRERTDAPFVPPLLEPSDKVNFTLK